MNGFRSHMWDPVLIISQIVAVQTLYYLGLGFWILLLTFAMDRVPSLEYVFAYDSVKFSIWGGRLLFSGVFLLNALNSGLVIVYVVGRYKQCLDFSTTIHFYHFLACWCYNGFIPRTFVWYMTQFLCVVIMTIVAEHLSKKYELRSIPVSSRVDL